MNARNSLFVVMRMRYIFRMLWMFFLSCTKVPEITPQEELALASKQVIFASVEQLGAHTFEAILERKEWEGEKELSSSEEILWVAWQDWDNFHFRRQIDEKIVQDIVVRNHHPWKYQNQKWESRDDAEPYRVELRGTWNAWDQMLSPFEPYMVFTSKGLESQEERRAEHYELAMKEPPESAYKLIPTKLEGDVWVDELTAVRLLADVKGVLEQNTYRKEFSLKIIRDIKVDIDLQFPSEILAK